MVAQLSSRLVSLGSSRRYYACRIFASRSVGRCFACELAAGSGSLRLSVRRAGVLDLLRVALHCSLRYLCNFAGYRLLAWGAYWWKFAALRRPRGRHGVISLAHRLRCMAHESG